MKKIMGAALAAVALAATACDDGLVDMPDLTVSTVEVGPSGRILLLDDTMRLTALPRTRDGTVLGSALVGWTADDPEVLEVTSMGPNALVRALRPGATGVRATADGKAGVVEVVVVASPPWAVALEITPQATTLATGRQIRLEATVRARAGTSIGRRSVTWRSSNGMVATVDSYGNSVYATLSAHSPGQAVITASAGGLETSVPVVVAEAPSPVLAVLVSPLSRAVWTSQLHPFTATVLGSGGTTLAGHPVDWSVEDTTVASIDAHGVALGRKPGTTRVFARSGNVQGWATLRVVPLPGETMDFLLLPNADPQGKPRVTVTVGTTTWLDSHGVEHPARLWWFFYSTQHWLEAGRWLEGAVDLPAAVEPSRTRGALLFAVGALAALQGRAEKARTFLGEAVELATAFGDPRLEAYALNYMGMTYAGEGRPEASPLCERAAAWFEAEGDLYGLRLALLLQGSAALGAGDMETAERHNAAGVAVARSFGLDRELAVSLQNLAAVHMAAGELERAEALLREALAASRRDPSYYFISAGLHYLGEVTARRGRPLEAARLLGAAEALREAIGVAGFKRDMDRLAAALPGFRQAAGAEAFDRAWTEGRALSPEALLEEMGAEAEALAPGPVAEPSAGPVAEPGAGSPVPAEAPATRARPAAEAAYQIRVLALGPMIVEVDGRSLGPDAWPYTKPKELLAYLLAQPGGGARDRIAQALWPEATAARLKNSFHVTLHHLRKTLGHPEWVVLQDDRYRIASGVSTFFDADDFEAEARRALADPTVGPGSVEGLRSILALYRGDFLEDEVVGGWAEDLRDRLRGLRVDLSLRLGQALEAAGEYHEAPNIFQAIAAREELNEEAHRRLMASWARSGDRPRALRHYRRVMEILRDTLDADPEPETVALHERIRTAGVP